MSLKKKPFEKIVGEKGQNAGNQHYSPFLQCIKIQKSSFELHIDCPLQLLSIWICYGLTLYHTILTFNEPEKKPYENMVGKGENSDNQHFLLFPRNVFHPS